MIKFGPGGNSISFYNEGYKSTIDAPKWLHEKGLDIYEYECGYIIAFKKTPECDGMTLHAVCTANDKHGAVDNAKYTFGFGGKVYVTGSVQQGVFYITVGEDGGA